MMSERVRSRGGMLNSVALKTLKLLIYVHQSALRDVSRMMDNEFQ